MSEKSIPRDDDSPLAGKIETGVGLAPHLFALLGYFLLALVVTYPAILHFTTAVPGDLIADRDQNLWNLWWLKQALGSGTNPFHTTLLYYPYGTDLYYHTLALPLGFIGLIPQLLLGLPAAYNTVLIAAFTFSGYGAFRLALLFLPPATPTPTTSNLVRLLSAFLAGVVFAFTPYTLDALKGQPEVLSLQWMPLYAEMWVHAARIASSQGGRETPAGSSNTWGRYALLAGLFLALSAYSSLYYAVYLAIFTVLHIAYKWAAARRVSPSIFRPGLLVLLTTLAFTLPLLTGLVADRANPRLAVSADPQHRLSHSADLLSFITPPHDHILFGTWQDLPGVKEPAIHDYAGLGYVALALALLGAVTGWRRRTAGVKFWSVVGLIALVLAMGPQLQIARNLTGIPLPFALLDKLPGMDAIAKPERFVVLARLAMSVLAAVGMVWLVGRVSAANSAENTRRTQILPFAVTLALLLVELPIHPRYMGDYSIPEGFSVLARQPSGGLMELPFATQQVDITGQRMLYQTVHGKPIMAGYLSRKYDSPIIDSCGPFWGFISPLDVPREDIASPLVVNRPQDVLNFYGIKYIALYEKNGGPDADAVQEDQLAALQEIVKEVAPGEPLYSSSYMSLHRVAQPDTAGTAGDNTPAFHVGAGWYNTEQSDGKPFRWLKGEVGTLCVFTPRKITASLNLQGTAFAQSKHITISAGGREFFAGSLPAGAFTPIATAPVEWQPGVTQVDIAALEPGATPHSLDATIADNRALTVGFRAVNIAIPGQK